MRESNVATVVKYALESVYMVYTIVHVIPNISFTYLHSWVCIPLSAFIVVDEYHPRYTTYVRVLYCLLLYLWTTLYYIRTSSIS
jgi:hypothetical protein